MSQVIKLEKEILGQIDQNIQEETLTELNFFPTSQSKKTSLQSNFEKFRQAKKQDIKYRNYVSKQSLKHRSDPDFKQRLREKFIETAKKYFGVPYAPKYWNEGEKHYKAPLYLDCCALIRQIVHDLREDFGFQLDRWNQAYQFDTLPIDLKFEDMKPGDLVFYSGIYFNEKMRKQKHNMVHVEIFTGGETGEQSIGARWQKGVVQYFDSYKFESKSYHSIVFHYKSIDTWLEGICKSHCDQHSWSSSNVMWAPGKKSIFSIEDNYDDDDLNAPELGEENDFDMKNDIDKSFQKNKMSNLAFKCFVGNGNNEKLAKSTLVDNLGFKIMDKGMMFSKDYRFKWTQTSMEINFMHFQEGKQICNHFSNSSKVLTNKISTFQVLEELDLKLQKNLIKSKFYKSSKQFVPETYRLDVVADLFQFLNSSTQGLWLQKKSQSNMGRGIKLIKDIQQYKDKLLEKKDYDSFGKIDPKIEIDSTEILLKKLDAIELDELGQNLVILDSKENLNNTEKDEKSLEPPKQKNLNNLVKNLSGIIIQKYLENPSLLNNKKYDVRYYMLIACSKPYLVLTNSGYARISLEDYKTDNFGVQNSIQEKTTHLTNAAVQKYHPNYNQLKESSICSMNQLMGYFMWKRPDIIKNVDDFEKKIIHKLDDICKIIFETVKDKLDRKFGCFELFGFDFMFDENLNPYFIEINTNPALFTDTQPQKDLIPKLVDDTIKLALQLHQIDKVDGNTEVSQFLNDNGINQLQLPYRIIYSE